MSDKNHREEREYVIRVRLGATFGPDYEGDEDGFAWYERFDERVRPRIARAVIEALRSDAGWRVTPVSRGLDESDALELEVERIVER